MHHVFVEVYTDSHIWTWGSLSSRPAVVIAFLLFSAGAMLLLSAETGAAARNKEHSLLAADPRGQFSHSSWGTDGEVRAKLGLEETLTACIVFYKAFSKLTALMRPWKSNKKWCVLYKLIYWRGISHIHINIQGTQTRKKERPTSSPL